MFSAKAREKIRVNDYIIIFRVDSVLVFYINITGIWITVACVPCRVWCCRPIIYRCKELIAGYLSELINSEHSMACQALLYQFTGKLRKHIHIIGLGTYDQFLEQ